MNLAVRSESDILELTVGDEGCGFDASRDRGVDSLGLVSMKERARLINAALEVESTPGLGTTVRVTLERKEDG